MNINENKEIEQAYEDVSDRICIWEGCTAPRKPGSKSQYCTTHRKAARQKWLEMIINNSKGRRPN